MTTDLPARRSFANVLFAGSPMTAIGASVLGVIALLAVFAPLIAPHDPNLQHLAASTKPPMWLPAGERTYVLGTDNLGRDILSRIIWGARIALVVGLCVVAIGGTLGVSLGLIAGYYGGWADAVIARVADMQLAFPLVLLAIAVVGVVGPGLWTIVTVLGVTSWVQYVRVIRAETLSLRQRDFVQAAYATGVAPCASFLATCCPTSGRRSACLRHSRSPERSSWKARCRFSGSGRPRESRHGAGCSRRAANISIPRGGSGSFRGLRFHSRVLAVNLFGDGLRDALDPHARTR